MALRVIGIVVLCGSVLGTAWQPRASAAEPTPPSIVEIDKAWNRAVERRDLGAQRAADTRLKRWLAEEMRTTERKLKRAKAKRPKETNPDEKPSAKEAYLEGRYELLNQLREVQHHFDRDNARNGHYRAKRMLLRKFAKEAKR